MDRGKYYGLNFYLSREIPVWDPSKPKTGVLLLRGKNCSALVFPPYACSDIPEFLTSSGTFAYQVTLGDSLAGLGSGRKPE
jgi:hypothetical protein